MLKILRFKATYLKFIKVIKNYFSKFQVIKEGVAKNKSFRVRLWHVSLTSAILKNKMASFLGMILKLRKKLKFVKNFKNEGSRKYMGSVVPYSFFKYQKYYVEDPFNPNGMVWVIRRVNIRRACPKDDLGYNFILPFSNPDNFSIHFAKKPVVYFGNNLHLFQFFVNVWYRYKNLKYYKSYLFAPALNHAQYRRTPYELHGDAYFSKMSSFMKRMFGRVDWLDRMNNGAIQACCYPGLSHMRERIFDLNFFNKEEILIFIDYLDFIKWELKIESIFTIPNLNYRNYLIYPGYKHVRSEIDPFITQFGPISSRANYSEVGEYFHGPLITTINELLAFLYTLKELDYPPFQFSKDYNPYKFKWERFKCKIRLIRLHYLTLREAVISNLKLSFKFVLKRAVLIYFLSTLNKFFIYPFYFFMSLRAKKGDWKVEFGSYKLFLFNLKQNIKNPLVFNRIKLVDKLKVILFNIFISIPLRILFNMYGINKYYTFEEIEREWIKQNGELVKMHMQRVAPKTINVFTRGYTTALTIVNHSLAVLVGQERLGKLRPLRPIYKIPTDLAQGQFHRNLDVTYTRCFLRASYYNPKSFAQSWNLVDDGSGKWRENLPGAGAVVPIIADAPEFIDLTTFQESGILPNPYTGNWSASSFSEYLISQQLKLLQPKVMHQGQWYYFDNIKSIRPGEILGMLEKDGKHDVIIKNDISITASNDFKIEFIASNGDKMTVFVDLKEPGSIETALKWFKSYGLSSTNFKLMALSEISKIPDIEKPKLEEFEDRLIKYNKQPLHNADHPKDVCLYYPDGRPMYFINRQEPPMHQMEDDTGDQLVLNHTRRLYREKQQLFDKLGNKIFNSVNQPLANKHLIEELEVHLDEIDTASRKFIKDNYTEVD